MGNEKIIKGLSNLPFFSGLNENQLGIVSSHIESLDLQPETTVFSEGDVGNSVYFVIEGTLEVVKESDWGESVKLTTLAEGSTFGEMSMVDNYPRSATVVSKTQALVLKLHKDDFNNIIEKHQDIGVIMLKELSRFLCRHVREANESLSDFLEPI